jgi:hypothetical protein
LGANSRLSWRILYRNIARTNHTTLFVLTALAKEIKPRIPGYSLPDSSEHYGLTRLGKETVGAISRGTVELLLKRASYNGSIEASQASDVGSIPIARSRNFDDSIVLTPLNLLKMA